MGFSPGWLCVIGLLVLSACAWNPLTIGVSEARIGYLGTEFPKLGLDDKLDQEPTKPPQVQSNQTDWVTFPAEASQEYRQITVGALLPLSGPPALAEYAERIREGIEAAAASVPTGTQIRLLVRDYGGEPVLAAAQTRELERSGAVGIVGYLEDEALLAGARARRKSGLLLVSPTSRTSLTAGPGVYSLEGPDTRSARMVARFARDQGYRRVGVVHSNAEAWTAEARAFADEARVLGLPVAMRLAYPEGATYYQEQLETVMDALRAEEIAALELTEDDTLDVSILDPVAIYISVPEEDLELLAPQVTHFGLDTLAINILGNSSWTGALALSTIDHRHTTGVVAPTAMWPEAAERQVAFAQVYEEHFSKSLVSPIPALGYDAALVLFDFLQLFDAERRGVTNRVTDLGEVRGVTGVFTLEGGSVVRKTRLAQVWNGVPVEPGSITSASPDGDSTMVVDTTAARGRVRSHPPERHPL